jgi:hypothetical protein
VGVALTLPSLAAGLYLDDYILWASAARASALHDLFPRPLDPFAFIDGDPGRTVRMIERGLLPWWTPPHARLAFWRPATAFTHWLDFTLWPRRPALMHLQNLAWFAGLLAILVLAYGRLIGRAGTAGAAALLYATNGANALGVAWIAGRSVMLATLFGALCLWAHDRWRRAAWPAGPYASAFYLALGLACAESAVATTAYLFAHVIFLDTEPWRRRWRALVPGVAVGAGWLFLYRRLGYGVFAVSPMFVDPVHEPSAFVRRLIDHGPALLLTQWLGLPIEGWPLGRLGTLLVLGVLALLLAPLLRRDRVARFWCLGQLLALVPLAAAPLSSRYTFFVGLGAMALLATFARAALAREAWASSARGLAAAAAAIVLVAIHLTLSPAALARTSASFTRGVEVAEASAHALAPDADRPDQRIVVVKAPRDLFVVLGVLERAARREPIGASTLALAYTSGPVRLARIDARTIVVAMEGEQAFSIAPRGLRPGQTIRLGGVAIEVGAVSPEGQPLETRVVFDVALEDRSLKWLRWSEPEAFVSFTPPAVGQTVIIR